METRDLKGLWKLVDVTNSPLSGRNFDTVLHFVDDRYFYDLSAGEVNRHRYRLYPKCEYAEIDFGIAPVIPGICKIEMNKLFICRSMPGKSRPLGFDGVSYAVYEYIGEGPEDWKVVYKQQIRKQIEKTAQRFTDHRN